MDLIDKLREFVLFYPGWETGKLLFLDYTDATPGNGGLFPEGITQVSFREDILGNRQADMRLQVFFYRCGEEEEGEAMKVVSAETGLIEARIRDINTKIDMVGAVQRNMAGNYAGKVQGIMIGLAFTLIVGILFLMF